MTVIVQALHVAINRLHLNRRKRATGGYDDSGDD
jgi:hypothetical protein